MTDIRKNEVMWDDTSINVSKEVAMVWSIANKLRGPYKPDKYKDVIIPMTIIRRFECALENTKSKVLEILEKNPNAPAKQLCKVAGYDFYNISKYDLKELLNDSDNIAENFVSYINGFSSNIQDIINSLEFTKEIEKMDKNNRLLGVVKAFSELDLNPKHIDNMKMGYIFEDIIRRFSENAEAGDHYTPREVIRLLVNILMAEGCDDLYEENKVSTVMDCACGTGGMLSTAYDYIKRLNPSARVELFGQEINPESYAICLADMLIKGQNSNNIKLQDTMIKDAFEGQDMRFAILNPPFGQPWGGKDAAEGVEKAVNDEAKKGFKGRFGAGTPGTGDMQLLFFQHAINKLDDNCGRAAIICNGSPLFSGGTTSGESQIRKWLIDEDYIDAIIGLPTDLFYNTNIGIYAFIFSKNKEEKRKGKIQLINATGENFWTPLRKSLGKKRKEISNEQIKFITQLYSDFEENEFSKIFNKDEFKYKEYTVYQPMQRDYAITKERIDKIINDNVLSSLYDQDKVDELMLLNPIPAKEKKKLDEYLSNKHIYEEIIEKLRTNVSNKIYLKESEFLPIIKNILEGIEKKHIDKVIDALSSMNKEAEIKRNKKGEIIWDTSRTKDIEIVKFTDDVDEYMAKEVVPHVPDAGWFFEEKLDAKKPIIKTGAEFPFTRYFYEYKEPEKSRDLLSEFMSIEEGLNNKISSLLKED